MSMASVDSSIDTGLEGFVNFFYEAGLVEKVARTGFEAKIVHEAEWILSLPVDLRARFPRVVRIDPERGAYTMEAVPGRTVSDLLFENYIDASAACEYWARAFRAFLDDPSFERTPPNKGWCSQLVDKAQGRIQRLCGLHSSLAKLGAHPVICIDRGTYLNLPLALTRLAAAVRAAGSLIDPPALGRMHLDLQLGNIIAAFDGVLIDPRGDERGDPLYDVMKGLHHVEHTYVQRGWIRAEQTSADLGDFRIHVRDYPADLTTHVRHHEYLSALHSQVLGPGCEAVFGDRWRPRFWLEYATTMAGGALSLAMHEAPAVEKSVVQYLLGTIYVNRAICILLDLVGDDLKAGTKAELLEDVAQPPDSDDKGGILDDMFVVRKIRSMEDGWHRPAPRESHQYVEFDARMRLSAPDKERALRFVEPGSILDLGTGNGVLLGPLRKRFPTSRIVGVDYDQKCLNTARAHNPDVELLCRDLLAWTDISAFARQFDTVLMSCVLHEVESQAGASGRVKALQQVSELLKPGGTLVLRDGVKPTDNGVTIVKFRTVYARRKYERFLKEFGGQSAGLRRFTEAGDGAVISKYECHDFLCKYYFEGELWERDMRETFGAMDAETYRAAIASDFLIEHVETYTPPYLRVLWERDFEASDGFPDSHVIIAAHKRE